MRAQLRLVSGDYGLPTTDRAFRGFVPIPVSVPAWNADQRFIALCCGVRSGKSLLASRIFLKRILQDRREKKGQLLYWIVGPQYDPPTEAARRYFDDALENAGIKFQYLKSEKTFVLDCGVEVELKSADRPDTLRSVALNGMWVTEAAIIDAETWDARLYSRLFDRHGWGILESSPEGRNWFYEFCARSPQMSTNPDKVDPSRFFSTWFTEHNIMIPDIEARIADARAHLPEVFFKREFQASWDALAGQIYIDWNEALHVVGPGNLAGMTEIPKEWSELWYSYDPATGHNGVLGAFIRDPWDRVVLIDEFCRHHVSSDVFGEKLGQWYSEYGEGVVYIDPSAADIRKRFSEKGFVVQKANNDVIAGVRNVSFYLSNSDLFIDGKTVSAPLFYVAEKCRQTRKELPTQKWGPLGKPIKKDDDAADMVRYGLTSSPMLVKGL